jgi:hypothetical protein
MNICTRLNGIKTDSGKRTNEAYTPVQIVSMNSSKTRSTNKSFEDKQSELNGGGS